VEVGGKEACVLTSLAQKWGVYICKGPSKKGGGFCANFRKISENFPWFFPIRFDGNREQGSVALKHVSDGI